MFTGRSLLALFSSHCEPSRKTKEANIVNFYTLENKRESEVQDVVTRNGAIHLVSTLTRRNNHYRGAQFANMPSNIFAPTARLLLSATTY